MKLLFLTQYGPLAASSRVRVFEFVPYLTEAGHQVRVVKIVPDRILRWSRSLRGSWRILYLVLVGLLTIVGTARVALFGGFYDYVFIQKVVLPRAVVALLASSVGGIVYDFDDAIQIETSPAGKALLDGLSSRKPKMFPNIPRAASLVVVNNDQNMRAASEFCRNVIKIVGPIDVHRYCPSPARDSSAVPVIGWIGSPPTARHLGTLTHVLRDLRESHPFRFVTVGSGPLDIPGVEIETFDWSPDTEIPLLHSFDIGIGPLIDDEYARGKGGYKLLQYMAVGIPVVASTVGENAHIVVDGLTGFLAVTQTDWQRSLSVLLEDAELRDRMGREGRARVEAEYSYEVAHYSLVAAIEASPAVRRQNEIARRERR